MKSTTITVNPLTLKYVNSMKGLLEYLTSRKYSLDDTILELCMFTDYEAATRMGSIPHGQDRFLYTEHKLRQLAIGIEAEEKDGLSDQVGIILESLMKLNQEDESYKRGGLWNPNIAPPTDNQPPPTHQCGKCHTTHPFGTTQCGTCGSYICGTCGAPRTRTQKKCKNCNSQLI